MNSSLSCIVRCLRRLGVKAVSFDFYGTLVARTVAKPEDVFAIAALVAAQRFGDSEFATFADDRIRAMRDAKRRAARQEITLEEIYACMPEYALEEREHLMRCEMLLEKTLVKPIAKTVQLMAGLQQQGFTCIVTSDMYLPAYIVGDIATRFGVNPDGLYVSSEVGLTKRNGALFEHVCKQLSLAPSQVMHIGDNVRSDYLSAKRCGLHAKIVSPAKAGEAEDMGASSAGALLSGLGACSPESIVCAPAATFGYRKLGPLLVGFSCWLHSQLARCEAQQVFFLARDGLLLKRVYELLYGKPENVRYLRVSRRACALPFAYPGENVADVVKRLPLRSRFTFRSLLSQLGFADKEIGDAARVVSLHLDASLTKEQACSNEVLLRFLGNAQKTLASRAAVQKELLLSYLADHGFSGAVAVVDVGWNGTLQKELSQLCGGNASIAGFYIGVNSANNAMRGYLFNDYSEECSLRLKAGQGLFEHFFLAGEGSVLSYRRVDGKVVPVFDEGHENEAGQELARQVQAGVLRYVQDVRVLGVADVSAKCPAPDVAGPVLRAVSRPTADVARLFSGVSYFDSEEYWLSRSQGLACYLAHPSAFASDFHDAGWKSGFLRETFRLGIDYGKLYACVRAKGGAA